MHERFVSTPRESSTLSSTLASLFARTLCGVINHRRTKDLGVWHIADIAVGLIDEVKTAQAIIDETVAQFHDITGRLGALAAARGF